MNENKWKKIRAIRIKPISIIIAFIVILAFFALTAQGNTQGDNEAEKDEITTETVTGEIKRAEAMPVAGITKELAAAAELSAAPEEAQAEETDTIAVEEPEEENQYCEEIPASEQLQEWFIKYSIMYDCPLALAYATADVETEFTTETVGAAGEIGIMQIYPGKSGRYFEEYERQIGLDPASVEGNIACGCWLLGNYLQTYGDIERAAMAYNMGVGGAMNLWDSGVYSSKYSRKVKAAYEKWNKVLSDGA